MEAWDAAAWVVSVLGTTDANAVAALTGRTREQVLKMDRRSFLQLKPALAMASANKLAFAVSQLLKEEEEVKARAREAAVSAMMTATTTTPVVSADQALEKCEANTLTLVDGWTVEDVVQWAEKNTSSFTAEKLRAASITGARLLSLVDLEGFVENPMDKRRLEYALSKLREPLGRREQDEAQVLTGTFTAGPAVAHVAPKLVEQQQFLGHGVFAHISFSENGFLLEVENSGKVSQMPVPIVVSLDQLDCENVELESRERKIWVLPNVEVKVPHAGGTAIVNPAKAADVRRRAVVLVAKARNLSQGWRVTIKMSYKLAESAEDWIVVDNEKKKKLAEDFAAKVPNFSKLSPPELQLEIEAAKLGWFCDLEFPPTNQSLYIDPLTPPPNTIPVQWKRPCEMTKSPVLFARPPGPNDIQQGRLGSCWFLAALSLLDTPKILRLFETVTLCDVGVVAVRFYSSGSWRRVVMDDYIPSTPLTGFVPFDLQSLHIMSHYKRGTGTHATPGPLYARCSDPDAFWVSLLEKGYAKLNRSFEAISGGSLGESLSALTGAPSISIFLPWEEDKDVVFDRLLEAHAAGMLLGCATRTLTLEERLAGVELERVGIVSRHAYGILAVKRVKTGQRFVRVRNPWGRFTWNGAFSDASPDWNLQLKQAVEFKEEPGCWWMLWKDFQQYFHDVSISLISVTDNWPRLTFSGVYDQQHAYGFQGRIVAHKDTPALITVAKEDLRYAQGTDSNNRQGMYLLEQLESGELVRLASSGEFARQEVTLEATLKAGKTYCVAVMAQIGSLLFSSVRFDVRIESREAVACEPLEPCSELMMKAVVAELRFSLQHTEEDRFASEVGTLQHLCFKRASLGQLHNSDVAAVMGCGELLVAAMRKWPKKRDLQNGCASTLWNMSSSPAARHYLFKSTDALHVLAAMKHAFPKDEEMLELADVATRNITNPDNIVAQDPLIEECILAGKCTFSVSGSKSFLLQVWYDCITCNLVSNFGVCQSCRDSCHKGHEVSAPKFSRFYCDCGAGKSAKKSARVIKCICVDHAMRKKREKDLGYYDPDEDELEEEQARKKLAAQIKKDQGKKKTGIAGF